MEKGLVVINYGVRGSPPAERWDVLVYADMARWEINSACAAGGTTRRATNYKEDFARQYKRAYFCRLADMRPIKKAVAVPKRLPAGYQPTQNCQR